MSENNESELHEKVLYKKKGKVGYITINNPSKKNAIEKLMVDALLKLLNDLEEDSKIACVVINSVGDDVFSAGWDLGIFQSVEQDTINFLIEKGAKISQTIHNLKKPVIVAVQGPAVGMGTIISLAADFIIAAKKDRVFFQLPELDIGPGIFPATGPTVGAVKKLGVNHAKDMLLTGRRISLDEFNSWGAITEIVDPPEELDSVVKKFARNLSRKSNELLYLTKTAINIMSMKLLNEFYGLENEMAYYYFDGMMGKDRIELNEFLTKIKKKYESDKI